MRKTHLFLFLILTVVTSGCSLYKVSSEDTTLNFYPSKATTKDIEYIQEMTTPYEVIGYVTVNAERRQSMNEVVERMKREAAILGGDAVINIESDATGEWKKLPAQQFVGNAYVRANFKGAIVVLK
ncbi:MAG: hypothetical protein KBD53_03150 [Candidatus Omnitrophica bacterium]|nr:hypothetical protein [Candidatus Omnitrophota bacterium]